MLLQDKVAVVTGAGRGIGKEIVRHFLEEGAFVVAFDIRSDLLEKLNQEFASTGRVRGFQGDVTNKEDLKALKDFTLEQFQRVDILVNNAGIARFEPFLESTDEIWKATFAVNVEGTYQCSKVFAEVMKEQKSGVILNMSSVNGMLGEAGMSHYNASKAAILLLSRTMANELAAYGIRCNSICPGYILTELSVEAGVGEDFIRDYVRKIPLGRLGNPRDVAYAAAFLASDRASFITGTELVVDGGQIGLM
jgi:3-oxoacyl-[acyl-carrier protein] reductase